MIKKIGFLTKWIITLLCSAYLISGCAEVLVKHVNGKDDTSDGVHFCQPRPYLLLSNQQKKDASGDVRSNDFANQIIWLPDYTQCYVVKIKPGWGTVDGSVKLQNGWMLDTLGSKMDSKTTETITALSGMATTIAKLGDLNPQGLYLINISPDGKVTLEKQPGW